MILSSVEAEELVEDDAVELDDVELALAGGEVCEGGGDGVGFWGEEVVAVAGGGEEGVAGGFGEVVDECRGRGSSSSSLMSK